MLFISFSIILGAGNWQTITNTDHVFDVIFSNGLTAYSTWGGVISQMEMNGDKTRNTKFNPLLEYGIFTTGEGLVSNDIRTLELVGDNLWLGSSNDGISIISPAGIQNLDVDLGLPSLSVRAIRKKGSQILVATSNGIAEYYYLPGVSFPLLLHQYRYENTSGGLASNDVRSMFLGGGDYLYFGTHQGISWVHSDSLSVDSAWHTWTQMNSPVQTGYEPLIEGNGSYMMIRNGNRIYRRGIDPWINDWEQVQISTGTDGITAIQIDHLNRLWIAFGNWDEDLVSFTTSGDILLAMIDAEGNRTDYLKNQLGLAVNTITRIIDSLQGLMLASWGDGYYIKNYEDFSQYKTESIGFPKISASAADNDHIMWFVSGYIDAEPVKKGSLGISYFDGQSWTTKNMHNSPLHNDSAHCLTVDSLDRVWFGAWDVNSASPTGWKNGVTIFDRATDNWKYLNTSGMRDWLPEIQDWGPLLPGKAALIGSTIGGINTDLNGNVFVACYDRGYTVIGPDDTLLGSFTIPNSTRQRVVYTYHNGRQYFFGTNNDNGLVIWNDNSIPTTEGTHWVTPQPSELSNCLIYGVVSIQTQYPVGWQHWVAASNGLFMWDETNWYKYDTSIKRFIYNSSTHTWDNDQLYYADEERLFGSVRTTPTAIYLDPFGRVWIGCLENGITMYDPDKDRFTNYFLPKDPLLSNYISSLSYEPVNGLLWIGTPDGLNTLKIGRYIKPMTSLDQVQAFPNPFHPGTDGSVQIVNLPVDSMPQGKNRCKIYNSGGAFVIELSENEFARFAWDGNNDAGKPVSSGIYFFVVTDSSGVTKRGKIALIR